MLNCFQEYGKAVSNTDDKVQLANHIHDLVSKIITLGFLVHSIVN